MWIILCAAIGGIASAAVAVAFLWMPERQSARMLPHFLSFATGALLGAAFLALLPDAIEAAGTQSAHGLGVALVAGLGFFFVIEKAVLWWHSGAEGADGPAHISEHHGHGDHNGEAHGRRHASGILVLFGDSLHNALDGVLICAAFLNSVSLGLVSTFAVVAHEVPHRVGDFAILVHAGWSPRRALLLNLATGLASVAGAIIAYFALRAAMGVLPYALAVAAAGFLYIAVAGLIPGLHGKSDPHTSFAQIVLMSLGILVIAWAERLTAQ